MKLQGGEPTIMRNCKEFCQMARQYPKMKIAITTNGVNLNQFWLETLVNQGHFVNISLNAASKDAYDRIVKRGDYDKVVGNIAKLVSHNQGGQLRTAISMVILPANIQEIPDFLKLGAKLGLDEVNFIVDPVLSFKSLPEKARLHGLLDEAYALIQKGPCISEGLDAFARRAGYAAGEAAEPRNLPMCPMPFKNLVVDEKGDVRVCCNTWQVIGNTYQQTIAEILAGGQDRALPQKDKKRRLLLVRRQVPGEPQPQPPGQTEQIRLRGPARPQGVHRQDQGQAAPLGQAVTCRD